MRVALCLSGQSRNWQKSIQTIKSKIIRNLDADVFIHTWEHIGNHVAHSETDNYYHDKSKLDSSFVDILNPISVEIEEPDYEKFIRMMCLKDSSKRYYNTRMMWYSIYKSNELKRKYEEKIRIKYDVVIRCRFDLQIKNFDMNGYMYLKNTIYLPPNQNTDIRFNSEMMNLFSSFGTSYMPNDQLAYGSSELMDYYSSVFLEMEKDFCKYPSHPEGTLTHHLFLDKGRDFNVEINPNILMRILR